MFERLLVRIAAALVKHKIPYMVIGGQAVLLYGEPRATKDIDITLGIGIEDLGRVFDAAGAAKLRLLVARAEEFARRTMVVPARDDGSGIRVDFILSFSDFERQAIGRARRVRIGRRAVRFARLEDLVIHKMIAGRPRDIEDVESILLKNPAFDAGYIRSWLREFDRSLDGKTVPIFSALVRRVRSRR